MRNDSTLSHSTVSQNFVNNVLKSTQYTVHEFMLFLGSISSGIITPDLYNSNSCMLIAYSLF